MMQLFGFEDVGKLKEYVSCTILETPRISKNDSPTTAEEGPAVE